jgi:hypothetical protein
MSVEKPAVAVGELIEIGRPEQSRRAIVTNVFQKSSFGDIEAIYIDDSDRAICKDFVWRDDHWDVAKDAPPPSFADNSKHLRGYVNKLRGTSPAKKA